MYYISKIAAALTMVAMLGLSNGSYAQNNPNANPHSISINADNSSVAVGAPRTVSFLIGNNGSNPIPAGGASWIVSFPKIVTVNQASLFRDGGPFTATWTVNAGGTLLELDLVSPGIPAKTFNGPKTNYTMTVTVTGNSPGGPLQFTLNDFNEALIAGNANNGDDNASSPISVTSTPLPVKLTSFSAGHAACNATLNWTTSGEQNADRYEVEVSNSSDGYVQAGVVKARGNSNMEQQYSFDYAMKPEQTCLFRLKMVDKDGSYTYSQVQKLSCRDEPPTGITIAPNPVVSSVSIKGMGTGANTITIQDVKGNKLKSYKTEQQEISLDLTTFIPGVYTVRIEDEQGGVISKKLIKQ